ncbi:hypothetical protein XA68_15838 [Ophiocordyceps unilateralis]|uniref:DUF3752 domain-containing protein n=1 Tax=Ophiocordyceps unilateralis TaxID=268505 RepID=A0A2A9P6B4_OPHUN|nr:hypothetical protein XA68_15838 [Ophiocordyceps unilateralis]
MASIGPQLPAQSSKRKRTSSPSSPDEAQDPCPQRPAALTSNNNANADEIDLDADDADASAPAIGPSPPSSTSQNTIGPSLPQSTTNNTIRLSLPPGPPPPTSDDNPTHPDPYSDSDSDSYGPALPAPQRDTWMLAPPPAKTTYTERDPTRLRARKFASKPTATAPPSSSSSTSIWTETPEEKLRRLQDSVLGRSAPEPPAATRGPSAEAARERESNIAATVKAQRGTSLYDEHDKKRRRGVGVARGEEDDPSKRAFDKDKDMALGGKIGTAKRRELVSKSANFGGRFQKGSYL